jgi:hypothetical protein
LNRWRAFGAIRRFKCYANLKSTMPKLGWLWQNYEFRTMADLAAEVTANGPLPRCNTSLHLLPH